MNVALTPDGRYAAVLHCGYSHHEVEVVDLADGTVTCRTNVQEAFYGVTFSADGQRLYCSGASGEDIHTFHFHEGQLERTGNLRLHKPRDTGVPCGLAIDNAGEKLYAANLWSSRISCVDLKTKSVSDVVLDTNAETIPLTPQEGDDLDTRAATKRAWAAELARFSNTSGAFPYACLLDPKRHRLYVSLWGAAAVAVLDTRTNLVLARWETGQHPCEMVLSRDGKRLFVANANENTVSEIDTITGRTIEHFGPRYSLIHHAVPRQTASPCRRMKKRCSLPTPISMRLPYLMFQIPVAFATVSCCRNPVAPDTKPAAAIESRF